LEKDYEIPESFNTSWGLMVRIQFYSKKRPEPGQKIKYKEIDYVLSGVLLHSSPYPSNLELIKRMEEGIYDCSLKSL